MELISGKEIQELTFREIREEVQSLKDKGIEACLAVIIVGNDPASRVYVNNKKKACETVGIKSLEYALPEETTTEELLDLIGKLNSDETVNGILCQLPVPKHINKLAVIESISPKKDVDCFHPVNVGKLSLGRAQLVPCTPAGVIRMLDVAGVEIEGKRAVVIGRSDIVGKPMGIMLMERNATVTVCHSKTKDLSSITKQADILVATVGKQKLVTADMVKEGAVVIDVGINRNGEGKLCGDVDFENVAPRCSKITPVPGGVGPMTITMLMKNTVTATKIQNNIK
ncbi:MAG: bifunctional methylenetetrahydrofolate dehydrogenase/methenyltetrahydrofolate cyclohydrolase FolD [Clostridia bacterium]|nr:bifunctional methylenetetrahydrofolate dehydrogenase/methenyltetrahydrofolate cyclohydrolase FolD [Clostridia bacterium]